MYKIICNLTLQVLFIFQRQLTNTIFDRLHLIKIFHLVQSDICNHEYAYIGICSINLIPQKLMQKQGKDIRIRIRQSKGYEYETIWIRSLLYICQP
jgi:hypothetical protein